MTDKNLPSNPDDNPDVLSDYEYSRSVYKNLIDAGNEAMEGMTDLARESEHPRAYEVLSGMMKNIADVTDKLMDLQKKKGELTKSVVAQDATKSITNNNVFVGSTVDLQRMLQDESVIDVTDEE